jgi:hypothetical protein
MLTANQAAANLIFAKELAAPIDPIFSVLRGTH